MHAGKALIVINKLEVLTRHHVEVLRPVLTWETGPARPRADVCAACSDNASLPGLWGDEAPSCHAGD